MAAQPTSVESISSPKVVAYIATVSSDTPLVGYVTQNGDSTVAPAKKIRAVVGGNLGIKDGVGNVVVVPILAGETQEIVISELYTATTTATGLTVYW